MKTPTFMMPFEPNKAGRKPILIRKNPITIAIIIPIDIVKTSFQIIIFIFYLVNADCSQWDTGQ